LGEKKIKKKRGLSLIAKRAYTEAKEMIVSKGMWVGKDKLVAKTRRGKKKGRKSKELQGGMRSLDIFGK